MNIVIAGDSHTTALKHAVQENLCGNKFTTSFISSRDHEYRPIYDDANGINTNFLTAVQEQLRKNESDYLIAMLNGNHHAVASLCLAPLLSQRFDFIYPGKEFLENQAGVQILPFNQVKALLKYKMASRCLNTMTALRRGLPTTTIKSVSPPPPIKSEKHILENTSTFDEKIKAYGISPATFRLKFWLLQVDILREFYTQMDIEFFEPPLEVYDEKGFLLEKYWTKDPFHANKYYGELVLNQVEKSIEV